MKSKPKREPPVTVPLPFDEAIERALKVKPPQGGWRAYETKPRRRTKDKALTRAHKKDAPQ